MKNICIGILIGLVMLAVTCLAMYYALAYGFMYFMIWLMGQA